MGLEPGPEKHSSRSRSMSVKKESNHSQKHHSQEGHDRDKHRNLEEQDTPSHHHRKDRRKSGDGEDKKSSRSVRQAPPRTPTPPCASSVPPYPRSSSPPSSGYLGGRSFSYKETKWQKEQDHYESQSQHSRRRDYDAGNYYEKETTRRSDGRGFGFGFGSYDDDYGIGILGNERRKFDILAKNFLDY